MLKLSEASTKGRVQSALDREFSERGGDVDLGQRRAEAAQASPSARQA